MIHLLVLQESTRRFFTSEEKKILNKFVKIKLYELFHFYLVSVASHSSSVYFNMCSSVSALSSKTE